MNKFFKKLAGLIQSKADLRKLAVFCILVFAGAFLVIKGACAQDLSANGFVQGIMEVLIKLAIAAGEFFIKCAIFCLYFFIQLAKYNDYINVPTVQIGWTMVRDVANMFFVVVLLMIAIGTILGLEQYQWNKTLAKMVLAAVFINFSNMICGIFIDVAHIFTITFVNAIASTAGGNLVNMFSLTEMYSTVYNKDLISGQTSFDVRLLVGAVAALLFAFLAMATMVAYLIIMVARVVVLWVLIILSPLAFILQVIPQTQTYATQWWGKFGKQVVVAPVIVFFLWLAFATAGQGDIATRDMGLQMDPLNQEVGASLADATEGSGNQKTALSWAAVTTWESMANFLIPMALLLVGASVAGQMGVVGGGAAAKATDFFKKAAAVATGFATARWLGKKGWEGVKKPVETVGKFAVGQVKSGLMNVPLVGGRAWKRKWNQLDEWRRDNKIFRLIPFIGGYQDDYNNKLDERQKKQMVMSKERRYREMSYERGTLDKVGGWLDEHTGGVLGFGLKTASRRKNDEEGRLMYAKDRAEKRGKERQANVKKTLSDMSRAQLEIFMREEDAASGGMVEKWQGSKEGQEWRDKWLEDHKTTEEDVKNTPELRDQLYDATREEWAKTEEGDKFYNDKKKGQEKRYNDFMYDYKHAVPTFGLSKVPLIRRLDEARDPNKVYRKKDDAAVQQAFEEWKGADLDNRENVSLKEFLRTEEGFDAQFEKEDRGITGGKQSKWGWWSTGLSKIDREAVTQSMGALWLEQRQLTKTEQAEEARNDAMKVFRETQIGKKMVTDVAEAGVGKKIGEDFYKAAQNAQVKLKWEEARDALEKARKADALTFKTGGVPTAVDDLLKKDKFVAAIEYADEAKATELEAKAAHDQADKTWTEAETAAWEYAGIPLEGPEMTQLMRIAGAETASKAAEEYLKTVRKNWPRYENAANELQKMEDEIDQIDRDENLPVAEKDKRRAEVENKRTEYLHNNPYAASVHYEREAIMIDTKTKGQKGRVTQQFALSGEGQRIADEMAKYNILATAGEDALKMVDSKKLQKLVTEKDEALTAAGIDPTKLDQLAHDDPVIRAMVNKADALEEEGTAKDVLSRLSSNVKGQFIDMKVRNFTTPPVELIAKCKRDAEELRQLDETGRGVALARVKAKLCLQEENGEEVSTRTWLEAVTTLISCNDNGNVDDAFSSDANIVNKLEQYQWSVKNNRVDEFFGPQEQEEMKRDLPAFGALRRKAIKMGWIDRVTSKGKIKKFDKEVKVKMESTGANKENAEAQVRAEWQQNGESLQEWADSSGSVSSGKMQAYVLTKGDGEFVDAHFDILDKMDEWDENDFVVAAQRYFSERKKTLQDQIGKLVREKGMSEEQATTAAQKKMGIKQIHNYGDLEKKLHSNQTIFRNVAEQFKEGGVNAGHYQLSGNVYIDEKLGQFRFMRKKEHEQIVGGTTVKRSGLKPNPQGLAEYVNATGHINFLERSMASRVSTSQVSTVAEASQLVMPRTRRAILDLHKEAEPQKDEEGYGMLSDSDAFIRARGNGDYLVGLFERLVRTQASAVADFQLAPALLSHIEFKNTNRVAAENGFMKAKMAGFQDWVRNHKEEANKLGLNEDSLTMRSLSQMAEKIRNVISSKKISEEVFRRMDKQIADFVRSGDLDMAATIRQNKKEMGAELSGDLLDSLEKAGKSSKVREEDFTKKNGDPFDLKEPTEKQKKNLKNTTDATDPSDDSHHT